MLKFHWFYLIFVFAGLCGCEDNSSNPAIVAGSPQSVSFEIQLPPQGSSQEIVEIEFPVNLDVPISRLSSIRVSATGTASAATHSCGDCASGANLSGGFAGPYLVSKQISISIETSNRLFEFQWHQEADGNFVISDQRMRCDFNCYASYEGGKEVIRVKYGSGSIDAFFCSSIDTVNVHPDFCSLDSGSVVFDKSIVFTVDYNSQSKAGGPLWEAKKVMY